MQSARFKAKTGLCKGSIEKNGGRFAGGGAAGSQFYPFGTNACAVFRKLFAWQRDSKPDISFLFPLGLQVEQESAVVRLSTDERLPGSVTLQGEEEGSAQLTLSLLGLPLKSMTVQVQPERVLYPGGQAVGIAMYTDGVFVVDCANVYLPDGGTINPAKEAGLKSRG